MYKYVTAFIITSLCVYVSIFGSVENGKQCHKAIVC